MEHSIPTAHENQTGLPKKRANLTQMAHETGSEKKREEKRSKETGVEKKRAN